MEIELIIQHEKLLYVPSVVDTVKWQTERKGSPGILEFKILSDSWTDKLSEGDPVQLKADNKNIFFGYIFKLVRNKERVVSVTAYDQLRYLKNRDTYVYENKTADDVLKMICSDFKLKTGAIEKTPYIIPSRIENNKSLMDIIQNALDLTLQNKNTMYVLYDDFGMVTLKSLSSMITNVLIDEDTACDYDYSSDIDSQTYNKVKLAYDDEETGKREVYIAQDGVNIGRWGVLQHFDTLGKNENGKAKAAALLNLYNAKNRTLSVKNAFGNNGVRAGSMVYVRLDMGNIRLDNLMLVEKCVHEYSNCRHMMSLDLRGGEISA